MDSSPDPDETIIDLRDDGTGPRSIPHRRCDCGKICLSHAEAHRSARYMNGHQQREGWPVHAYRCGTCWHVGHVPSPARKDKPSRRRGNVRGYGPRPVTPADQLPPELR